MAVLPDLDRADAALEFIQEWLVRLGETADLDTNEIRTLINDLDASLEARKAAINGDITLAVRNKASNATKYAALAWVAMKRAVKKVG